MIIVLEFIMTIMQVQNRDGAVGAEPPSRTYAAEAGAGERARTVAGSKSK